MSFNIGVLNAAVTLDNSDFKRKAGEVPQVAESNFRKVAELAAAYLTLRGLFSFIKTTTMSFSALENAAWNFNQTFRTIPGTAAEVEQRMRELYKLSEQTSKGMLSTVGDQLQAFGMGAEDSLLWAERIAKRGIDLASYKGGNQADAVSDITRALTGETDGMKKWGVVIRQGSKEFEDMLKNIQSTTGATENLARAQAIFEIILKQSANAEGDYLKEGANIAQTLANIRQQTLEATSSMGAHLSGGVRPVLEGYEKLLGKFNDLDPAGQKIVMRLAAMSGAMLLLQTSAGKAVNAKLWNVADKFSGGGDGIRSKAEAAAVEASEAAKQAAYNKTAAVRAAHSKVTEVRIAREAVAEARLGVARASVNLELAKSTGTVSAQTAAKRQLLVATQALAKAQATEAQATAAVAQSHLAARNAIATHAAASNVAATASATAAKASTALGRAQIYLAGGLRTAAAGAKALFVAIGPLGWTLLAITAATSAWEYVVGRQRDKLNGLIATTDKAVQKTNEDAAANDRARDAYRGKAERLQELAGYTNRNNAEQEEAMRLAKELHDRYGDLGITVNKLTGEITIAAEAWNKMSEAEKKYAEIKLDDQIRKQSANIKASLQGAFSNAPTMDYAFDNEGYGTLQNRLSGASDSVDLLPEVALVEVEKQANEERKRGNTQYAEQLDAIAEKIKILIKLNNELEAVRRKGAAANKTEKDKSEDNKEQRAAREKLENARREKDMDGASAARQDEILAQKEKELRKKLFDSAGNKPESEYSKEELEIAKQIVDLERQRAEIRKKSADSFKDEAENFSQSEERRARENERRQTDREISKLESEQGGDAVKKRMEQELQKARESAERMKAEYDKAIKDAQEDGVLTDEERKQIQEARRKLDDAMSDEDTWTNKLADYDAKDRSNAKAAVAFSSDMLTAMIGASPTDKAIEKNTKQSVDIQRDSKKLLEDIKNKPNSTVLK